MSVEVITMEDLQGFRQQLLHDIRLLLARNEPEVKQWLRSAEVRKMLKISAGTLQSLRIKGVLKYTKLGGVLFYSKDDIQKALEDGAYYHK